MNRNEFWSIIGNASHLKIDEIYEKLYHELSQCSVKSICHFGHFLMLYVSCAQSPASWLLCKLITGGASDDSELYFRLWLGSLGRTVFLGSLKKPDFILESNLHQGEYGFEELMHLASSVLSEKTLDVDAVWRKYSLPDEEIVQEGSLESVTQEFVNAMEDAGIQEIMKEIEETGVDILPYAYTGSSPIRVIGSNRKIGFMNKKGMLVIPPQYEEAEEFQSPLTVARKNGKWGIINKKEMKVVPIRYDKMRSIYFEQ